MEENRDRASCRAVAVTIESLHDGALGQWYGIAAGSKGAAESGHAETAAVPAAAVVPAAAGWFADLVVAQHRCNYELWGLEDEARRRDVTDSVIAAVKRAIDVTNQRRNDLTEQLDDAILAGYRDVDVSAAELNSETAGQMIDRLSILALKVRNMREIALDPGDRVVAEECAARVAVLEAQRADLAQCLRRLLADYARGARYFKSYRQFKAYNDPRLNPALSRRGS